MRVILVRHAKSHYDWSKYPTDAVRPLSEKGKTRQLAVATGMKDRELQFNSVWCSPYKRALETLELIQEIYHDSSPVTLMEELVPGGDESQVFTLLRENAKKSPEQTILIVSHNPLLSALLELISRNGTYKDMKTSDVALCEITPTQSRLIEYYPRQSLMT